MKRTPDTLTLAEWQELVNRCPLPKEPPRAFRADGTQFSVARFYGGCTAYGTSYTMFEPPGGDGALLLVSDAFLRWAKKEIKKENAGHD